MNQALIFYHYASVDGLLAEASRQVSGRRAAAYADRLATVRSFRELAAAARELHREEREIGNLVVLTQLLAAARTRPQLQPALRDNFDLLALPVEAALQRLTAGSVLDEVLPTAELARSLAGGSSAWSCSTAWSPTSAPVRSTRSTFWPASWTSSSTPAR